MFAPVANCTACPRKPNLIPGNTATRTTSKSFYVNTGRPRDPHCKYFHNIRSVRQVSGCFALRHFFVVEYEYLPQIVLKMFKFERQSEVFHTYLYCFG